VDILKETAAALYERRHLARSVPFAIPPTPGYSPVENDCHANATKFCRLNKNYTPLSGWLLYDLTSLRRMRFIAHSVVRHSSGQLYDVTPGRQADTSFLEHEDQDMFYMIVTGHDLTHLDYPY